MFCGCVTRRDEVPGGNCKNRSMAKFQRGKLLERQTLYAGRIVDLVVDRIELNGTETIREVVRHPGGVVILARTADGRIPFVRQHRYPIERDLLELPAGKIDPGEDPEITACRELEEETGYRAESLQLVASFYTSPGFCTELLHFYYAEKVVETQSNPEADEELELELFTLGEALHLVETGQIQDGKSITALYWLDRRMP
jgi:ADP-ribose pyrophosphatase